MASTPKLDNTDKLILSLLQSRDNLSIAQISRRVSLSNTSCWNRIQKMEENNIIKTRVAILDRSQLNLDVIAFVAIRISNHEPERLQELTRVIPKLPEVTEFYRLSGSIDYLIKVAVPDIKTYDEFYQNLISKVKLDDVTTSFAMEEIKHTTALPLSYMQAQKDRDKDRGKGS